MDRHIDLDTFAEFRDYLRIMNILVTEEIIARQAPEAQAIIRTLLAVIELQQATIDALNATVSGLTERVKVLEDELGQKPKSLPSRTSTKGHAMVSLSTRNSNGLYHCSTRASVLSYLMRRLTRDSARHFRENHSSVISSTLI